jgi:hypothetical protein
VAGESGFWGTCSCSGGHGFTGVVQVMGVGVGVCGRRTWVLCKAGWSGGVTVFGM